MALVTESEAQDRKPARGPHRTPVGAELLCGHSIPSTLTSLQEAGFVLLWENPEPPAERTFCKSCSALVRTRTQTQEWRLGTQNSSFGLLKLETFAIEMG